MSHILPPLASGNDHFSLLFFWGFFCFTYNRYYTVFFLLRHISLNKLFPRSMHIVPKGRTSFSQGWIVFHCIYVPHLNLSFDTHLGCFSISVIVNNAAINMEFICLFMEKEMATHFSILAWRIPWTEEPGGLQSLGSHRVRHVFSITSFNSSGYTARSGITGLYVSFIFNFLRTLHTNLQSHQQRRRGLFFPKPSTLVFSSW